MRTTSKYSSLADWEKSNRSAYSVAKKKDLLSKICKNFGWTLPKTIRRGYWTKERCIEDALLYNTKSEWENMSGSAYNKARVNNWLDECCGHMTTKYKPSGYWTKERCIEEASRYSSPREWEKGSYGSYDKAVSQKWTTEIHETLGWTSKTKLKWTKTSCLSDASNYFSPKEWSNESPSAYVVALRSQWTNEIYKQLKWKVTRGGQVKNTLEVCKNEALKYNSKKEWETNHNSTYQSASRNNWLQECCSYMINGNTEKGYWTKERCIEDAIKYDARWTWGQNSSGAYTAARKNKWMDECCQHMVNNRKPNGYWTKERCVEDALKYKSRIEWIKKSNGAYDKAMTNEWLPDCIHSKNNK